jgi:pilus assembly protein Flp/PilA
MNAILLGLYVKFENLVSSEEGQDLVEYALLVALISLGAIASTRGLAHAISTEFSVITVTFTSSV